jgi:hypothetical protein
MAIGCNCDMGLSNTGRPNCLPLQSVTSKLILVPLQDNAGAYNGIDLTSTLPVWANLVNDTDPSQRWYPLPAFENVELPKAETVFEEANSGRMAYLRQGKRSFSGELWAYDSTPQFLGKLASGRCVDFGVFIVDINGSLIGAKVGTDLRPIPVDNQSWNPTLMFATDSTVQKIMLAFDWNRYFDESTLWMVTADEASQNFNDLKGLLDVNLINPVQVANTSITVDATFDYGTALNPLKFKGALLADFDLYDNTNAAPFVITAVSEPNDGEYVVLASFVTGDSYTLSVTKAGFTGSITFTAV